MAYHPAIESINREPQHEMLLTASGLDNRKSLVVKVMIKKAYWGLVDPADLLTDDRLPAAYSSWPVHPYPQTNAAGVPLLGFTAKDNKCRLQRVAAAAQNTHASVTFTYYYESNPQTPAGALPQEMRQNPDGTTPGGELGYRASFPVEEVELPYTVDGEANRVLLSSGERPDPMPTRKFIIRVANIARMEKVFKLGFYGGFSYVLNDAPWNGKPAETVCCFPITYGEWQEIGGELWWPVNYTFKWLDADTAPAALRPTVSALELWRDIIISMSYNQLGPDGELQRIRLKEGPATVPQGLDAAGHWINPPGSADPHKTTFYRLKNVDLSPLNITLPTETP